LKQIIVNHKGTFKSTFQATEEMLVDQEKDDDTITWACRQDRLWMTCSPEAHYNGDKEVCQFGPTVSACVNSLVVAGNNQRPFVQFPGN